MKRSNFLILMVGVFLGCSLVASEHDKSASVEYADEDPGYKEEIVVPKFAIMVMANPSDSAYFLSDNKWASYFPELKEDGLSTRKNVSHFYYHDPKLRRWIDARCEDALHFNNQKCFSNIPDWLVRNLYGNWKDCISITFQDQKVPVFVLLEDDISKYTTIKKTKSMQSKVADYEISSFVDELVEDLSTTIMSSSIGESEGSGDGFDNKREDNFVEKARDKLDSVNYDKVSIASKNIKKKRQYLLKGIVADINNNVQAFSDDIVDCVMESRKCTNLLDELLEKHMAREINDKKNKKISFKDDMDSYDRIDEPTSNNNNNCQKQDIESEKLPKSTSFTSFFKGWRKLHFSTATKSILFVGVPLFGLVCFLLKTESGQGLLNKIGTAY